MSAIFTHADAWGLCAALNGPDPLGNIAAVRALTLKLLADYLSGVRQEGVTTEVVFNHDPSVNEWLTKDGWRFNARDNMEGYGPSLSAALSVLDIGDAERGALDPAQVYHFAKWVWRAGGR